MRGFDFFLRRVGGRQRAGGRCAQHDAVEEAHTLKGKGISFMEDDNNWHYRIPTADEVRRAKQELRLA